MPGLKKVVKTTTKSTPGAASASGARSLDLRSLTRNSSDESRGASSKKDAKPNNADVNLYITKYTNDARDFRSDIEEKTPFWLCRLIHAAAPSVEDSILDATKTYLQHKASEASENPKTLQELAQCGISLDFTKVYGKNKEPLANPDKAPLVHWSIAYWVAGDEETLLSFIEWFCGFVAFRATRTFACDKAGWPDVKHLKIMVRPSHPVQLPGLASKCKADMG
jgi:hypothetical protein